jgi:predicted transcriptional regulator
MRALSIRQPYAELILRGIKTVELRSRSTRIVGERFYMRL